MNVPITPDAAMPFTADNVPFQILVLVVAGLYLRMIYHYRDQVAACLKNTASFSPKDASKIDNRQLYDRFLNFAMALGAIVAGIVVAKTVATTTITGDLVVFGTTNAGTRPEWFTGSGSERLFPDPDLVWLPLWMPLILTLGAGLVSVCIVLLQTGILKAAGALTLSGKIVEETILTKKTFIAALTVVLTPGVLVFTGMNPMRNIIIFYITVTVAVVAAVIFAVRTLRGFIMQKVLLLVWFLYLCTVEIFPIGFIVLLVLRNV